MKSGRSQRLSVVSWSQDERPEPFSQLVFETTEGKYRKKKMKFSSQAASLIIMKQYSLDACGQVCSYTRKCISYSTAPTQEASR